MPKDNQPVILNADNDYGYTSPQSRGTALLLAILFGYLGIHRFYVGKIWTGLLYLCTFGLFVLGWGFDILWLMYGDFSDKAGRPLQ